MSAITDRDANLLGSFSLAVAERIRATGAAEAGGGESPAALVALAEFLDAPSIRELSAVLGLTHSATVRLVDSLEERGLAIREAGADGRAVALRATARGEAKAHSILAARAAALEELLAPLSLGERRELARLHSLLLGGLVDSGAAPEHICRLCDTESCGHASARCPVTAASRAAA